MTDERCRHPRPFARSAALALCDERDRRRGCGRADASRVLWANATGAALLGAADAGGAGGADFRAENPLAADIARLAGTLPPTGRGSRSCAPSRRLHRHLLARRRCPAAAHGILVIASEPARPALPLAERAERLFAPRQRSRSRCSRPTARCSTRPASSTPAPRWRRSAPSLKADAIAAAATRRMLALRPLNGLTRLGSGSTRPCWPTNVRDAPQRRRRASSPRHRGAAAPPSIRRGSSRSRASARSPSDAASPDARDSAQRLSPAADGVRCASSGPWMRDERFDARGADLCRRDGAAHRRSASASRGARSRARSRSIRKAASPTRSRRATPSAASRIAWPVEATGETVTRRAVRPADLRSRPQLPRLSRLRRVPRRRARARRRHRLHSAVEAAPAPPAPAEPPKEPDAPAAHRRAGGEERRAVPRRRRRREAPCADAGRALGLP